MKFLLLLVFVALIYNSVKYWVLDWHIDEDTTEYEKTRIHKLRKHFSKIKKVKQ